MSDAAEIDTVDEEPTCEPSETSETVPETKEVKFHLEPDYDSLSSDGDSEGHCGIFYCWLDWSLTFRETLMILFGVWLIYWVSTFLLCLHDTFHEFRKMASSVQAIHRAIQKRPLFTPIDTDLRTDTNPETRTRYQLKKGEPPAMTLHPWLPLFSCVKKDD